MKTKHWYLLCVAMLFVVLANGCKDNPSGPTEQDKAKAAMNTIIANDAFFTTDYVAMNDGDASSSQSASLNKATTNFLPLFWGRKILSASRTVDFTTVTDSTASATVTNSWSEIIWAKGIYSITDTVLSLVTKNANESTIRNVKFVRINRVNDETKNWRISEISVMEGGTTNGGITFTKVTFYIGTDTLEITNPLDQYYKLQQRTGNDGMHAVAQSLVAGFKIRVEVLSADSIRDYVVACRPVWDQTNRVYQRGFFTLVDSTREGDMFRRTYEHSWRGAWTGRHHVFIGAVTHQSVFDDQAAFSSKLWGIPYIVE